MAFKKRAPRAIKEIKKFAEKAMVSELTSPAYKLHPLCVILWISFADHRHFSGHARRPVRPAAQQEGLGVWHQGRTFPSARANLEKAKRRGGCKGEAVQLRTSGECEESQGIADGGGGRCLMRVCSAIEDENLHKITGALNLTSAIMVRM